MFILVSKKQVYPLGYLFRELWIGAQIRAD